MFYVFYRFCSGMHLKNEQEVNFVSSKGVVINLPKDLFVGGFNITILLSFLHKNRNVLLKKQQWA